MSFMPCLVRAQGAAGGEVIRLGHPLLDAYVELVTARARWNTVLATAFDLKVFFSVVDKDPVNVEPADVLAFIKEQRRPRRDAKVVRIEDGEAGLSARTIKRRLATIAGLYRVLDHPRRRRCHAQPGASRPGGAPPRPARSSRGAAHPGASHLAPRDRP